MSSRWTWSFVGVATLIVLPIPGCDGGGAPRESARVIRPGVVSESGDGHDSTPPAAESVNEPQPAASEPREPGVLEGRVIYHADPGRFWRYGRYYVKDKEKGWLAEAIVALRGDGLPTDADDREPATATMDQQNLQFIPETLVIRAGDRVKFLNNDPPTHNVSSSDEPHRFDVTLPFGGEAVETFEKAGGIARPVQIGCKFHGSMRAWIYVFDHPYFHLTGEDGTFRFENVPAGERRLEMVHPAGALRWSRKVEIAPGETTRIEIHVSPDDKMGS